MINFEYLEANKEQFRKNFLEADLFPHIAIDGFLEEEKANALLKDVPEIKEKSADYVFSKNKFEKSKIKDLSANYNAFYQDITSERFQNWLQYVTDEDVFVDTNFYGGGVHLGGEGSFLDMHVDFNYHPEKPTWYRNLNILLYMNKDWKPEYGGQLKLEDKRTGKKTEVEIPFNRLVIMHCRGYTLHGYDEINFPPGTFRTSMATYAYSIHEKQLEKARTTDWKIEKKNTFKYMLSKIWVPAVRLKSKFFKSKTADH